MRSRICTAAEAATPAEFLPPPAAIPHTTKSLRRPSGVIASTVMPPWPLTVAWAPMRAVLVRSWTLRPMAAPTPVSFCRSIADPILKALASTWSRARTAADPVVAMTVTPSTIRAMLTATTQLTETAPATPVPPPPLPDSLLALPLAPSAPLLPLVPPEELGRSPVPVFLVLGLSPLTCSLALVSPLLVSLSPLPLALATDVVSLVIVLEARTSTEAAVMFRAISARVCQPTATLIPMSMPTAVSLPAASALPSVEIRLTWVAATATAPETVEVTPAPAVPMRAMTWSSLLITRATTGVTAVPPAVPPSARVSMSRNPLATTLRSVPPVSVAPSATSARTVDGTSTWIATEAPTPVALPTSALPLALAKSRSLLRAEIVVAAVAKVAEEPASRTASVVFVTTLRARAPAMPTSSALLAPARAVAEISCSKRRNSWSVAGVVGKASPSVTVAAPWTIHSAEPLRL